MKVTRRLIIPSILILLVITLGIVTTDILNTLSSAERTQNETLLQYQNVFNARLEAARMFAMGLAVEVANDPEVQAAFANGNRERLTELTLPAYEAIDTLFDVPQAQFHLPPATSFLRLHQIDQYGDDLSSFRATVVEANLLKKPLAGLEIGRGGLGVRGIAPISYQNQHIGTVEFGLNLDQTLVNEVKSEFGADWQILLSRGPAEIAIFEGATSEETGPISDLLFQVSTRAEPLYGDASAYQTALSGISATSLVSTDGKSFAIMSVPLKDYSGKVIGVLDIILDRTSVVQAINSRILGAVGILGLALILMSGGLAYVATRTLRPIAELEKTASAIAQGDLSQSVKVESQDEIGNLARTFNQMTEQLRSLFGALEQRVAARTRALQTSAEVSRHLSTILDPNELVLQVVEEVKVAFDYYHAHIYLVEEDGQTLKMVGGTGEVGQTLLARGHKVSIERGLVGRAARTRSTVLVSDTGADANWLPNPLLPDTKSEIAVPIIYSEVVLGVLDVQQNVVNGLTEEDKELLETIASQTAIALQNASALATSEQRADALRESQELFQTILETTPIPFLINRIADSKVLYANRQYSELFRLPMEKLIGSPNPDFYYDPSDRANFIKKIQADGMVRDYEFQAKKTDGTPFWVSISVQQITFDKSPALLTSVYDLTERKSNEEALKQRAERDRVLNRIATKIRGAVSVEQVLQVAVQEVRQVTKASRSIAVIDPNEDTMSIPPIKVRDS
ncbi:MAG: GAF domain-containing protein [Anaerolineales bacterium]|nr:GAF domain-containing protein [Anaerolineales bacterium]